MKDSLNSQLAKVFKAGLKAEPELRASLAGALSFSEEKYTKTEAKYREADSEKVRCGNCEHMVGADKCDVVSGSIDAGSVCDYFSKVAD